MTAFALWRSLAKSLAPLCASAEEGAQATDLGQDKRDSLRRCPAVGLSLRVNTIKQAALSTRSLPVCASACSESRNSTSSTCAHVR